jgi:phage terminase large subunit-like protein
MKVLPGSTRPDELRGLGYAVEADGEGERLIPHAITEDVITEFQPNRPVGRRMPGSSPSTGSQFLNAASWQACGEPLDTATLKGRPCFAGLDLGATRDMTALVLVFADDDGAFDVVPYGGHPVLTTAAANAKVETDAVMNRKLSKKRSNGRIDPAVALCMSLGLATRQLEGWMPMLEVV